MNFTPIYLKTLIPDFPKIYNDNNVAFQRYLDIFYDGSAGVIVVPINTPGNVKAATAEFVTAIVDNLIVRRQYTNLYENITTANYDYYVTELGISESRRDPSTWEDANSLYIDVQEPYYKIIPTTGPGDYTGLNVDLKSQIVTLILDPSGATSGFYSILLEVSEGGANYLYIDVSTANKWVSLICSDWDASYGPTWEVYEYGGGGGGATGGTIDISLALSAVWAPEPNLADTITMPDAVGGLAQGTTVGSLRGQTLNQILTTMLFPTVLASVTLWNSVSLLIDITPTTMEVGSSYAATLRASYNAGTITNGDGITTQNLTGRPGMYIFKYPDGSVSLYDPWVGTTRLHTYGAYSIAFGSNIWLVDVSYNAGSGTYYDSKGNAGSYLDGDRVAGTVSVNSSAITGRRYVWYGYGLPYGPSAPTDSAGVRALTSKSFLDASNEGTFNISIPKGTQEVYFFIPAGKIVTVQYVESAYADVTADFTTTSITVNDAGGVGQSYESWVEFIGLSGYENDATYTVTIT